MDSNFGEVTDIEFQRYLSFILKSARSFAIFFWWRANNHCLLNSLNLALCQQAFIFLFQRVAFNQIFWQNFIFRGSLFNHITILFRTLGQKKDQAQKFYQKPGFENA